MSPIKIAIVSDLHIGNAREEMLWRNNRTTRKNYIDLFCEFTAKNSIQADYLFILGDLTDRGTHDQFREFYPICEKISDALSVRKENVIITPGNHDKDWGLAAQSEKKNIEQRLADSYQPFTEELKPILDQKNYCHREFHLPPFLKTWSDDNLYIVSFNSSAEDFPEDKTHVGAATQDTISQLDRILMEAQHEHASKIKVFLTHHHPKQYSSILTDIYPDYSIMSNADGLMRILHKHKFDFYMHGHKHIPFFDICSDQFANPIICFCSGSFSANLPIVYNGISTNLFHVAEIIDRNQYGYSVGKLKSWSYQLGHGWNPSRKELSGIEPTLSFGHWENARSLERKIRKIVEEILHTRNHAKWSEVTAIDPDLNYITREIRDHCINNCVAELSLDTYESEFDLVLVPQETTQ